MNNKILSIGSIGIFAALMGLLMLTSGFHFPILQLSPLAQANNTTTSISPTMTTTLNTTSTTVNTTSTSTVTTIIPPPTVSLSSSASSLDSNQTLTLSATISGGTPPYTLAWTGSVEGALTSTASDCLTTESTAGTYTCTITAPSVATSTQDTYTVSVTDSNSQSATNSTSVIINSTATNTQTTQNNSPPPALSASLLPTSSTLHLGSVTDISAVASGGTGSYTYAWYEVAPNGTQSNPAADCANGSAATSTCQFLPTQTGNYYLGLNVTDSSGTVYNIDPTFTVVLSLSTDVILPTGTSIATGNVSGGSGTYIVEWTVYGINGLTNAGQTWQSGNFDISGSPVATNTLNLTGGTTLPSTYGSGSTGNPYNLTDGNYTITFTAWDASNTLNTSSRSTLLDVDSYSYNNCFHYNYNDCLSISPTSGPAGTVITLSGVNFYPTDSQFGYCLSTNAGYNNNYCVSGTKSNFTSNYPGTIPSGTTLTVPVSTSTGTYYVVICSSTSCNTDLTYAYPSFQVTASPKYSFTETAVPSAGGSVTPGSGNYLSGNSITISETANTGYTFKDWTGSGTNSYSGTQSSDTFTITSNVVETANFQIDTYSLAATAGTGGSVSCQYSSNSVSTSCSGTYPYGTQIKITASPSAGYTFNDWTGTNTGSSNPLTVTMDNAVTETANFKIDTYTVTTSANPSGGGTVSGGSTYDYDHTATISETPSAGYVFTGWICTGSASSSCPSGTGTTSFDFTVTSAASVTANFEHAITLTVKPSVPTTIDQGQGIPVNALATRGTGSYTYSWTASNCDSYTSGSGNVVTFTPTSSPHTCVFTFTANDIYTSSTVSTAQITVDPALTISPSSATPTVDVNQQISLSATVNGGSGSFTTEKWYETGSNTNSSGTALSTSCSNPCTASYAPSSPGDIYFYFTVTDSNGQTATSKPILVTVYHSLAISVAPSSTQTLNVNQPATQLIASVTSGSSNPGEQEEWYSSSTPSCSSSSTNTGTSGTSFTPATSSVGTTYYCAVVTDNEGGNVASNSVEIVVSKARPTLATTLSNSGSIDAEQYVTDSATLSSGYNPTGTISFYTYTNSACNAGQSLVSTNPVSSNGNYGPSTSEQFDNAGTYSWDAVYSGDSSNNQATSPCEQLVVNPDVTFTTPVASPVTIDVGQTYEYSVAATGGTGTITYLWNSVPPTLTVDAGCVPYSSTDTTCTVSGAVGNYIIYSVATDTLADSANSIGSLTITADPTVSVAPAGPLVYDVGQSSTGLSATVTYNGPNTASVEWYSSSTASCSASSTDTGISGTSYTPSTASVGTTYYCAVVSDSAVAGYTSSSAAVEVTVNTDPTVSLASKWSPAIDSGSTNIFTATPSGGTVTTGYTYSWILPANVISSASDCISTTDTCTIAPAVSTQTLESVSVTVTDNAPTPVTSSSASSSVTYNPTPQVSLSSYLSTIDAGQQSTFTATIVQPGTAPDSFSWLPLPTGLTQVSGCGSTDLTCVVSEPDNALASTQTYTESITMTDSNPAGAGPEEALASNVLTVNPLPQITSNYNTVVLDSGQTFNVVEYPVLGTGTGSFTYTWTVSNAVLGTCGTSSTCSITAPAVSTETTYTLTVYATDQVSGVSNTETVTVNVYPPLATTQIIPEYPVLDFGQQTFLQVYASGGTGDYHYTWYNLTGSPVAIPHTDSNTTTFNALTSGGGVFAYDVVVTDEGTTPGAYPRPPSITSPTDMVFINAGPLSSPIITPISGYSTAIDYNQSLELVSTATGGSPPYTFTWYLNPSTNPPNSGAIVGTSANTFTFQGNSTTLGSDNLQVTAKDGLTETVSLVYPYTVYPALAVADAVPSTQNVDQGQASTVSDSGASGGSSSYSYQWLEETPTSGSFSAASDCGAGNGPSTSVVDCTFSTTQSTSPGTYQFELQATDTGVNPAATPAAIVTSAPANVIVATAPTAATFTASNSTIDSGQIETFTVTVTGGFGPFSVAFYNVTSGNLISVGAIPSSPGSSTLSFVAKTTTPNTFLTYNAVITDDGATTPYVFASPSNIITVNPVLGSNLTVSTTPIDEGQSTVFTANIAGGTPPYTYTFDVYNDSNSLVQTYNTGYLSSNTTSYQFNSTPDSVGVDDIVTVYVVDSATTPANETLSNTITVNPALSIINLTTNNPVVAGSPILLSAGATGGSGAYQGKWFSSSSATNSSGTPLTTYAVNSITSANAVQYNAGTYYYYFTVTDGLETATSPVIAITVNKQSVSSGGSGGSSGSSGGGGGGSIVPSVTTNSSCSTISNLYPPVYEDVVINGITFDVVSNFISPTSAGVSVNGVAYTLDVNSPISVGNGVSINLLNISYVPSGHLIQVSLCSQQPQSNSTTQKNSTTNNTGNTTTISQTTTVHTTTVPASTRPTTTVPTTNSTGTSGTNSSLSGNNLVPASIAILVAIAMAVAYYGYSSTRRRSSKK